MLSWNESNRIRRAEILNSFITSHFQDLRVQIGGVVVGSYPIAYFSSISEPVLEEAWGNLYIKFPIKLTEFMSAFPFVALAFHCVKILLKYKEDSVIEDVELNVKQIAIYSRELRTNICRTGTQVAFETFSNIHFKQLDKAIDADEIVMPLRGVLRRGFFYFGDYTALSTIRFIGKTRKEGSVKKQTITFTQEDLKKYAAPIGTMGNVLYIPFNLEQKFVPINKKNPQVYLEGCFHPEADEIMVDLEWSIPIKT